MPRSGVRKLGCLVTLLLAVALGYFAINAGEVYLRYYRFRDAMAQEARFARQNSDDDIRRKLRAVADSLGLPEEAGSVTVRRATNRVTISAVYHESLELPGLVRSVRFAPSVTTPP
jgi:hypothetical protein